MATSALGDQIDVRHPIHLCRYIQLILNTTRLAVVKSVAEAADRQYSYVVLTTKAVPEITETPSVLDALLSSPFTDKHTQPTYVLLQNGLGVERALYDSIKTLSQGNPRIISTVVWIATNLVGKNQVLHSHFVSIFS